MDNCSVQVHIPSVLCVLTWALTVADDFILILTRSVIKDKKSSSWSLHLFRFDDSDTLILAFGNRLHTSFDDGAHWETTNGIEETDVELLIDRSHHGRAFVTSRSETTEEIHVSEDQGKNWGKISKPEDIQCLPITNPFNMKLLLLVCAIGENSAVYGADDAEESLKFIMS